MEKKIKDTLKEKQKELFILCLANKIPLFSVFADETNMGTKYESAVVTPFEIGKELKNDKITKFSVALNDNFELRLKSHIKIEDDFENNIDKLLNK